MGWLLLITGWFSLIHPVDWIRATQKSLLSATVISFTEQWILMGIILGVFLREMKPISACFSVSLFFAFIHFLLDNKGIQVPRPEELDAGFQLLALTGLRIMHPGTFALNFVNLWILGLILAYARYRTASLWLPIGIYAGWLFILGLFQSITTINGVYLSHTDVFIGANKQSGILPLCLLIATGLLVHVFVQFSTENHNTSDKQPHPASEPTV